MQTIKLRSMGSDVVLLQQLLNKWGYKVDETGLFDEQTDIMVRDFQRKNKLAVDGIVGKGTWSKLQDENARQTATLRLTEEDFKRCADILGVEVAAVKAVQEVETGGRGGFFAPGRPAILFEGHIFWSQLKKYGLNPEDYVKGNEDILYPKWTKSHYKGGMGEYDRLKKAPPSTRKLLPVLQVGDCSRLWGSTMRHADVRMRESLSRRCVPTKEVNLISSRLF